MRACLLLLLAHATLLAQPGRFGLPSCSAPGQELAVRSAFLLCHSSSLRVPLWTAHELKRENLGTAVSRPRRFRRDTALAQPGAHDSDYRNSGYSRGHLVPAADLASSQQAVSDSFLLSNVLPQNSSLNSGKWLLLEKAIRRLAVDADFVVVFTGPICCATVEHIGVNRVAVPCQLYKVVLAARGAELAAYATILPNDSNPAGRLDEFAASVAEVERRTGLDFFGALPTAVQHSLESSVQTLPYGVRSAQTPIETNRRKRRPSQVIRKRSYGTPATGRSPRPLARGGAMESNAEPLMSKKRSSHLCGL
jgi:endonuclease G